MKRKRDPREHIHTPHPLHENKFPFWTEMIPEMQGCVIAFLDNGTKQILSMTCTNALKRWHVFMPSDENARIKRTAELLAENGRFCYITRFLNGTAETRSQEKRRMYKCISQLVKWNRWKNNNITHYILHSDRYDRLESFDRKCRLAFLRAIKWSNFECMDWIFSEGHIDDVLTLTRHANGLCKFYKCCGVYGNITALKRLVAYEKECLDMPRSDTFAIATDHMSCVISKNLQSQPYYAFEWSTLFDTEPFRTWWKINHDTECLADIISSVLGFEDDGAFHFEHIDNCYNLWKILGPNAKRDVSNVWDRFFNHGFLLFKLKLSKYLNAQDVSATNMAHILSLAEEMGLSPHPNTFYTNIRISFWPVLQFAADACVSNTTEVFCQWLIRRGALDLRNPLPKTIEDLRAATFSTVIEVLGADVHPHSKKVEVVSYIKQWFDSHTFEGASILRSIIDEVWTHPAIRLIMERES